MRNRLKKRKRIIAVYSASVLLYQGIAVIFYGKPCIGNLYVNLTITLVAIFGLIWTLKNSEKGDKTARTIWMVLILLLINAIRLLIAKI